MNCEKLNFAGIQSVIETQMEPNSEQRKFML